MCEFALTNRNILLQLSKLEKEFKTTQRILKNICSFKRVARKVSIAKKLKKNWVKTL
jgi:hypothetical protein